MCYVVVVVYYISLGMLEEWVERCRSVSLIHQSLVEGLCVFGNIMCGGAQVVDV